MKPINQIKIGLKIEFKQLIERAKQLVAELSVETFNSKPGPEKWSIGQHIHHLNVTGDGYLAKITGAIENAGKETKQESPARPIVKEYKPRFLMQKFINELEPPVKRKLKAPKAFMPSIDFHMDKDEILGHFIDLQDSFITKVDLMVELNLVKVKITSPATSLLKLQLGEAFLLITAHERRHLWLGEETSKAFSS